MFDTDLVGLSRPLSLVDAQLAISDPSDKGCRSFPLKPSDACPQEAESSRLQAALDPSDTTLEPGAWRPVGSLLDQSSRPGSRRFFPCGPGGDTTQPVEDRAEKLRGLGSS